MRDAPGALPRVAVIGAGSSGITACKALWSAGIPFDCFEKSDRVGGNWVFQNSNGMSSAYRSLHINTSRTKMQYADWPMPADYPDFPGHERIARYFDSYVDHFGFRHRIRFGTGVAHAARAGDGWRVTLEAGESRYYDALVVANGHHWDARWPEPPFPGEFHGTTLHSHSYLDPETPHDLRGKRVVVLGMGNSAMDIACELGHPGVAERVFLAARRGAHVIPKYLFGKPLDDSVTLPALVPRSLRMAIAEKLYQLAVGSMSSYGLPEPEHRMWQAHPTVSAEIFVRVGSGDVVVKPNLARLCGHEVEFSDGSRERVDAIVYCTGYKISFPFFDPGLLSAPDNHFPLFRHVFHPDHANLAFVGLVQPWGAIMPLAELQSRWITEYLLGRCPLPPASDMRASMDRDAREMSERYVSSKRHTIQVDFDDYFAELEGELRAGRARAAQLGARLPVAARARAQELT